MFAANRLLRDLHQRCELADKPRRQDRVHAGVQQVVRVEQLDLLPDRRLRNAFAGVGEVCHQGLHLVGYLWVDVVPGEFVQRVSDPTFVLAHRVYEVGEDAGVSDLRPQPLHRDVQRPLEDLEVVGGVVEDQMLYTQQRPDDRLGERLTELDGDYPGGVLVTKLHQAAAEVVGVDVETGGLGVHPEGLRVAADEGVEP